MEQPVWFVEGSSLNGGVEALFLLGSFFGGLRVLSDLRNGIQVRKE